MIRPIAPDGLHEFVESHLPAALGTAIDLGTGRGAMAERLQMRGHRVTGVDLSSQGFEAKVPHIILNLNQDDFAAKLGNFDLVTAVEVIEHVESPINFLRNVGRLLTPNGISVITTPNVDSLPARIKHLLTGSIRLMDAHGEPTHISPIFIDLFRRQFLPLSGLTLLEHHLYPPNGFHATRGWISWLLRQGCRISSEPSIVGDHHVFVLQRSK
jgi:SAM-dependent methyltransferase